MVACIFTSVVAFGFLPEDFGMWQRPVNGNLLVLEHSYYTHRWRGRSQTLPAVIEFI